MQKRIDPDGVLTDLGRLLQSGSLSDLAIQEATEATPNLAILHWVNVVKIGGQSIMDRGRAAVGPLVDGSLPICRSTR
jgi:molybdenum storage protein